VTYPDLYFIALAFAGILSTLIIATTLVVALPRRGARLHARLRFTTMVFDLQ